jgi:folate-binding protein YgfZ
MFSLDGYQALRHSAGIVRRGDRGVLGVTGADRLTWLQGLLTNDVASLPIGGACDAAYLTPQGRMITDMRVIQLADRALLDVPGSLAESLRAKLDSLLFSEDAQVTDVSRTLSIVDLHGPTAPDVIQRVSSGVEPTSAIITDPAYGVPGFSMFVPTAGVDAIVGLLVANAATETTLETLDVLRVEAGRPAFLIDMDEHTIPLEAGLGERAISFTKGCYVGQEVIVRVMHRGQGRLAKKLVGLRLEKSELPKKNDPIAASDRDVGRITSAVWSPTLERGIALGYVHRDVIEPGSAVSVRAAAGVIQGIVSSLPFIPS